MKIESSPFEMENSHHMTIEKDKELSFTYPTSQKFSWWARPTVHLLESLVVGYHYLYGQSMGWAGLQLCRLWTLIAHSEQNHFECRDSSAKLWDWRVNAICQGIHWQWQVTGAKMLKRLHEEHSFFFHADLWVMIRKLLVEQREVMELEQEVLEWSVNSN